MGSPHVTRHRPSMAKPLLVVGLVLLLAGLASGYGNRDSGSGRKLKQVVGGAGTSDGRTVTADLTLVTTPGGGAVATQTTTTQTTHDGKAGVTTTTQTTTTTATVSNLKVADKAAARAASGATGAVPAAPAASGSPAAAFGAAALPDADGAVFYASTHTPGYQLHPQLAVHFTTAREELSIPEVCTQKQAKELATEFRRLLDSVPFYTACGDNAWLDDLNKLSPRGAKVMLDVGCNKGYSSAKMFGLWAPELGFNPKSIPARRPEVWCGNCGDCHEELDPALEKGEGGLTVYCLEPSQANFAQLVLTRDAFFRNNDPSVQWLTMNLAMSNSTGVARFSRECTSEQCALNVAAARNADLIDTSTVDDFLKKFNISHVDVLKIDTEGFDAAVLTGAMTSIASGRVGVISFEYHEVGVWKEYRLRHVVEWLSGFGYSCYFDGKGGLSRLTGCWDDAYEIYQWSNVVCVPRASPIYQAAERRSLRYQKMPQVYGLKDQRQQEAAEGKQGRAKEAAEATGAV